MSLFRDQLKIIRISTDKSYLHDLSNISGTPSGPEIGLTLNLNLTRFQRERKLNIW
jgi:hypothetical protein